MIHCAWLLLVPVAFVVGIVVAWVAFCWLCNVSDVSDDDEIDQDVHGTPDGIVLAGPDVSPEEYRGVLYGRGPESFITKRDQQP